MTESEIAGEAPDHQRQAWKPLALSLVVNALIPYLVYRLLETVFAEGSAMPLICSMIVPLAVVIAGLARRRTPDIVALIAFVELAISAIAVLVAADIRMALVARALQGTLTGIFFLVTVLVRRPLIYAIARQFVAAAPPHVRQGFATACERDGGRTFMILTAMWGVVLIVVSIANLWLAQRLAPADFVLASPVLVVGSNVVMVAFTIRFATARFRQLTQVGV